MHRAATWNINGVGFDAREAAREAARRQGVSVGEWLQGVIADHAAERGVAEGDVGQAEQIEAVTARLERLEARARDGRRPALSDDGEAADRTAERRPGSRLREAASAEPLLEDAIEALERRALRSERKTDRTLARFAQIIETSETKRDDERAMFSALTRKLSDMETRLTERVSTDNPIKVALTRLEERLEAMGRRAPEAAAEPARLAAAPVQAAAASPSQEVEPIQRLEAKVNSILEAMAAKPADLAPPAPSTPAAMQTSARAAARARGLDAFPESRPIAPPAFANRRLGEAIAEIASHQRTLERRPPIPLPPRPARRSDFRAELRPEPLAAALPGDIADLTAKVEAMRRDIAAGIAAGRGREDTSAEIDGLRAEVAGLSRVMRETGSRAQPGQVEQMVAAFDDMRRDLAARQDAAHQDASRRSEAKLAAVASRADLDGLRAEISGLSRSLGQLAPRGSVSALEDAIRGLTARMEIARETQERQEHEAANLARARAMQPLDEMVGSLRDSLASLDPREALGDMEREVRTIGAKLQDLDGVDAPALARIQAQTQEIRDLVAAAAADPLAVERLEAQVAALARRLEQQPAPGVLDGRALRAATDEIRTLVENAPSVALFDKVERRLEALTGKIDQAVEAASGARKLAELSKRRFDDVQDQLALRLQAAPPPAAPSDLQPLEDLVRDLAVRIETVRAPDASAASIEALQTQVLQLSQRFERTDSELSSLAAIERSVLDLFTHLEDTRASVETAAARAAREAAKAALAQAGGNDPAALREIAALKAIQEEADHRTHRTLNAVHETLEKVVDRLSLMESEVASGRAPSPAAAALPDLGAAAAFERPLAPARAAPARPRPPSYTAPRQAPTDLDETAGRADFIAAARRAARTAQTDPSVLAIKAEDAPRAPGEVRASLMARSRDYVASHKKPVLLSIAALFVILGTIAVMGSLKDAAGGPQLAARVPAARPAVVAAAQSRPEPARSEPSRPVVGTLAADLTPSALPRAPSPTGPALAGSDPITTASIPRLPSFAAQAVAAAGPSVPSGALKQMADEGDAAAQYEVASRYAEGRQLAKDFKLAADWYDKAAQQGSAPAQYKLAALYEKGLGVPKDKNKAKYWYIKAADAGNPRAMHNLAVMVADGDGKPDYASAVIWFRKAAEYGVHDSQYNLAILLARGLGAPQSLVQSYQWFAVAAQENDADAATKRDQVGAKLSPSDLAVAKTLASTFHPKTANVAAVQVDPPSGGWDGASASSSLKSTRARLSSL